MKTQCMLYNHRSSRLHVLLGWLLNFSTSQIFTLWYEENFVKPYFILPDILLISLLKEAAHHNPVFWSYILSFCSIALKQDYPVCIVQVCVCWTSQTGVNIEHADKWLCKEAVRSRSGVFSCCFEEPPYPRSLSLCQSQSGQSSSELPLWLWRKDSERVHLEYYLRKSQRRGDRFEDPVQDVVISTVNSLFNLVNFPLKVWKLFRIRIESHGWICHFNVGSYGLRLSTTNVGKKSIM